MPVYQCHKRVSALKIEEVIRTEGAKMVQLVFENKDFAPLAVSFMWDAKHDPQPGGYYVVYPGDGYTSYSPAKAFEDGYTLVEG